MIDSTIAEARRRFRVPTATYRLQMRREFPIRAAIAIVPYLHSLGISHVYASSLLTARPGSPHGYDILDPGRLNPELGTEAELAEWANALHERGMGLILDVVPNHMCVAHVNPWWADILEHGPSSPFANHFDIAWDDHPRERLRGKVLLPILGDMYGASLESGLFRPEIEQGALFFRLGEVRLPIDPRTYGRVLNPALDEARVSLGAASEAVLELQSIAMAVTHLPPRNATDAAAIREGLYEVAVIKRRLGDLMRGHSGIEGFVNESLHRIAGTVGDPASFAALDEWLGAQAYRPAFWRVASDEINYRRFFDINDLAAISAEREEVFLATHGKVLEWLADGVADGVRIDHPDGLYDPEQYLDRLQLHYLLSLARARWEGAGWEAAAVELAERLKPAVGERLLYTVVEKILGPGERLPADWAAHGTTGYEFLNAVNDLAVNGAAEAAMTADFERFTGEETPYAELVYRNKFLILQSALAGELHVLAHRLDRLAQSDRSSRDFTLNSLRHALREFIACFPVYRSYITDGGVTEVDRAIIARTAIRARRRNPLLGKRIFEFIRDTLLLRESTSGSRPASYRAAQRAFAGKFQQVTSPVMAKGVEDTAFYVYNRLISSNEVGGEPGRFGAGIAATHAFFAARATEAPQGLSPLATHDTKRGADVRAMIDVLSEIPAEWASRAVRWGELNRRHKVDLEEGLAAPSPNEEYLLYQTLLGTWAGNPPEYASRIREYMNKVLHEAKVHSSWINPDPDYDAAVGVFVTRILDPELSKEFLGELDEFCARLRPTAELNALAQTLLQCTAPGIPDIYQGTELHDDSLVDPDNRRPVDYEVHREALETLDAGSAATPSKLFVASRALRLRRERPGLFAGTYVPLDCSGPRSEHAFAFLRGASDAAAMVVVPRLIHAMAGEQFWGDTALIVPEDWANRTWTNCFTGEVHSGGALSLSALFASFPVALLVPK